MAMMALARYMYKVVQKKKSLLKMNLAVLQTVIVTFVLSVVMVLLRKTAKTTSLMMMNLRMTMI